MAEASSNTQNIAAHKPISLFTKQVVNKTTAISSDEFYTTPIRRCVNYTPKEIDDIISQGTLEAQQDLSRNFFEKNGFYRRILLHYATVLTYEGILIPNPSFGKQLSTKHISKQYYKALDYVSSLNLKEVLTRISLRALIHGAYYGLIASLSKTEFSIIDLPYHYARSRFKDIHGNDIVEFDTSYFTTITNEELRKEVLNTYPRIVRRHYDQWIKNKTKSSWLALPVDIGICFPFTEDGRPLFLNVIPATLQYDQAVDTEQERELEEIRKIIVHKIPHLNDGQLVFEPDEALEMHTGAVNMLSGNKNLSVFTTYGDVDTIMSHTTADNARTALEKMLQNVYAEAGTSSQIFAPTGSQAIEVSIKNDMSLMMILGNKYSRFITYILNQLFSNGNINFTYSILPINYYNQSDYITDALKLAQSGYSFLLPAIGLGLSQRDLVNLKSLENDTLKLSEILIPLASSYTQSSNPSGDTSGGKVVDGEVKTPGAPEKQLEDKAKKTIQNKDAIDNQGGSNE